MREWLSDAPMNTSPYTKIDHADFSVRCLFEIGDEQIIILLGKSKHNKDYAKEFIMLALQQLKYFWHYKYIIEQTVRQTIEKQAREEEMRIASETQRALLPPVKTFEGVDLFAYMIPSKEVGGDYFEMLPLNSTQLFIAIADVCGKGISAAMLMANLQASLRVLLLNEVLPISLSLMVQKLNMVLYHSLTRDRFITMSCAIINTIERTIASVNAGHSAPFLITKNNQVKRLSKGGTVLGAFLNLTYEVQYLNYSEGDLLFFYTDGVTEMRNEANEEFGEERLLSLLTTNKRESTSEQIVITIQHNFSDEQRQIAQVTRDFVQKEILENVDRIEKQEHGLVPSIIEKAGALGLIGITVPDSLGGLGLSVKDSLLVADIFGMAGSFSTTYGVQSGIGILPILYYGTEEQKQKYIPQLVTGEKKACYCLTEPNAGSDANAGKSKAHLSDDGQHYILNGQKIWISNSGFADLFIVFAKIDDDKNLSAFIVEKTYGGIELGAEEKKLGIHGSSTRQVFFKNCPVPISNILSTRGNGFKIAVNVLNIGRLKLGAGILGGARWVLNQAFQYATTRKQFDQTLFSFGAIKEKIANMASRIYATESISYRVGNEIDTKMLQDKHKTDQFGETYLKSIEEFAIESSIAKVYGSESLDFITDEAVQIFGGMGYSAELPIERSYRDARISRIYEGTNEINRMLMISMLFKRAVKGNLDFTTHAQAVAKELTAVQNPRPVNADVFGEEKDILSGLKKTFLLIGGKVAQLYQASLEKEQEILLRLADILIEIYVAESAILRAERLLQIQASRSAYGVKLAKLCLFEAIGKIDLASKEIVLSLPKNDEQKIILLGLKRFIRLYNFNIRDLRREIANKYEPTLFPFLN
ncbi:hypothetical protein CHS0354_024160 [Potamilus streckersoni]|uniref:PPM-type phosphatase domain-containing protein n=1 Tax=Potamilus streckersoni TaxID=2493646 RepID=A0AAE0RZJ5_9BIVA|nr:hypothetical protein CHS0354_024160 [Potamilus streckersoni]